MNRENINSYIHACEVAMVYATYTSEARTHGYVSLSPLDQQFDLKSQDSYGCQATTWLLSVTFWRNHDERIPLKYTKTYTPDELLPSPEELAATIKQLLLLEQAAT